MQVLLVEDSPGDVRLTQEAFRDTNPSIHLHVANDGVEAMAFLRQKGATCDAPRPDLILLDLNMPRMDGRQVLAHIKEDESLKTIPTVILTTSEAEADIAQELPAAGQLLPQQAGAAGRVREPGEEHQRFLADHGHVAAAAELTPGTREGQAEIPWEVRKIMNPPEEPSMPLQVLLVEDSPGDLRLTQEAFRDVNPFIELHVASDGVEAMAFLRKQGRYLDAPRPDLILLDLNLPKMDGREVLASIKEDAGLKTIPTVILTSSEAESDVVKSYQLQANCYLSKPMHFEAFHSLVKSINDFWLTRVKLPQQRKRE